MAVALSAPVPANPSTPVLGNPATNPAFGAGARAPVKAAGARVMVAHRHQPGSEDQVGPLANIEDATGLAGSDKDGAPPVRSWKVKLTSWGQFACLIPHFDTKFFKGNTKS